MRENISLKQNESVRRVFLPMLQKKRNISLTRDKVSKRVLYPSSQSGFPWPISAQRCHYLETRPLVGSSNQWAGFYIMTTLIWSGLKFLTSRKITKFQTCKSLHKNRVKTKENSDACVAWEKEHPAETYVKFPHRYYDMQVAIQMFHETLLAPSCHYIRPSPLICSSNKNLFLCIYIS